MSDLTFGPSKVKRWFTGFCELSSGGYRFASVLRCVGLVEEMDVSLSRFNIEHGNKTAINLALSKVKFISVFLMLRL